MGSEYPISVLEQFPGGKKHNNKLIATGRDRPLPPALQAGPRVVRTCAVINYSLS